MKCCENVDNLEIAEDRGHVVIRVCRACGRKHYELSAEPGVYALRERRERRNPVA